MSDQNKYQEALKRATSSIEKLVYENDRLKKKDPIAIIGMGCRLPGGANSPEEYWRLLADGLDAISVVPAERWDVDRYYDENMDAVGKAYVREGGFLNCSPFDFDPRFFGITPKEAKALDPHQRLLLELAWEALENAGINPASLTGSRTGVFVGMSGSDYDGAHLRSGDFSLIDPYSLTGIISSTAVGRISYILGLEGPSVPVDTACSSSLVALHLACRSLQAKECDLALVGGVNMMLTPELLVAFCKLRALSPDGRCKTFDASANGYSRGEGCAMIVLKRLETAQQDDDRILAVVRGSALNNDGRSNGMTTPNGLAQRRVIGAALEDASLQPGDIDYIEAHGTGTPLGDPIEAEAIAAALGKGRDDTNPILIGSVKTNIGHLEAAAGVAGIIKLVLAIEHEIIPQHLHFSTPNRHIPWQQLPLKVVSKAVSWPRSARPRRAGISGFGFSGTNAHVILEEPPLREQSRYKDGRTSYLLVLSAVDETALRDLAALYVKYLENADPASLSAICNTASSGRNRFPAGLAVVGTTPKELALRLSAFYDQGTTTGVYPRNAKLAEKKKPVFLFTGQGSQYPGMGKDLYETAPVYREILDLCDSLFAPLIGRSIRDLMHNGSEEELARTIYTQPAIFSLEYSLAQLWRSWGISPSAVLGHSIGELVAACISGILSLEDAVTLVAHRGRLMNALPPGGVMAAVLCPEADAIPVIAPHAGQVSVAAVNAPGTVVISGEQAGVAAVLEALKLRGVSTQYLTVSHAFHSHLMDPALDEFEKIASGMTFHEASVPVISNVTGKPAKGDDLRSAAYWRKHLRGAVRFGDSIDCLKQQEHSLFLEIGATATLCSFVRQTAGTSCRTAASLKRGVSSWSTITSAMGELFAAGVNIDWKGYDAPYRAGRVALPTYPFQRERYFMNLTLEPRSGVKSAGCSPLVRVHPLLGGKLDSPSTELRFDNTLDTKQDAWLKGHTIHGAVIIPATAYIETALAAVASETSLIHPHLLEQLRFLSPLILSEKPKTIQTIYNREKGTVEIFSLTSEGQWQLHATMATRSIEAASFSVPEHKLIHGEGIERERDAFYDDMLEIGYRYGGVFRSVRNIRLQGSDVVGNVDIPEEATQGFILHPALLDGCLTLAGASFLYGVEPSPDGIVLLPTSIESLIFSGESVSNLSVRCLQRERNNLNATFDLYATNQNGKPVIQIIGLVMRQIRNEYLIQRDDSSITKLLYSQVWRELPPAASAVPLTGKWLVLADKSRFCDPVVKAIRSMGVDLVEMTALPGDYYNNVNSAADPCFFDELQRLLARLCDGDSVLTGIISLGNDSLSINLNLVRALLAANISPRLILVTSAVYNPMSTDSEISPHGAAIWGLGSTIASESPQFSSRLMDLSPIPDSDELAAFINEISAVDGEERMVLRGGRRFVTRLVQNSDKTAQKQRHTSNGVIVSQSASYLITGGLGVLGIAVAGWLVDEGCRHLVLMGRSEPSPEVATVVEKFRQAGVKVLVVTGDVAHENDVSRIISEIRSTMPLLKGIFHAAGLLDDAMLTDLDLQKLDRVMRPKIEGAWNLHRATEQNSLDIFVLFSSLTAVTGSPGQANYAAANAALDGFARWRRSCGLAAVSINWGPFAEAGLAAQEEKSERLAARGIKSISVETGLLALATILRENFIEQSVADIDLQRLALFIPYSNKGFYTELFANSVTASSGTSRENAHLANLRKVSPEERPAIMLLLLQELAAVVTGQSDPERIEIDRPLQEQGFDSLMAVDLRNLITKTFCVELPVSLLFDYPTIEKIGRFILDDVLNWQDGSEAVAAPVAAAESEKSADDLVDEIEQLLMA